MLTDESLFPFGKYKGVKMCNVPESYLIWCYDQDWCRGEVKKYIEENLDVIKSDIEYENKKRK